ncbi:flagellar biosynthesis protein FlhF [Breznakiellaceae bacterium SP9]
MKYFTESGYTYNECMDKIHSKYGSNATIVIHKTIRIPKFFGFFSKEGVELTGIIPPHPVNTAVSNPVTALSAEDLEKRKADLLDKTSASVKAEAKPTVNAGRADVADLEKVLNEVKRLGAQIEAGRNSTDEHPSIQQIRSILTLNDFSEDYSNDIIGRIKKEFSLEDLQNFDLLQDKVLEWIGDSIKIFRSDAKKKSPRIIVLVGPTGVGKTTTIAKLAAKFGVDEAGKKIQNVSLITIDAFRIGAKMQLEAYGKILDMPTFFIENFTDLRKTLALYSKETDVFLIDTIGKSPRDSSGLGEMKEILDACGSFAQTHLALAASTKSSDIREVLQQFEFFNYQSVLITKIDETRHKGNFISILAEKGKSVSYITNGQAVPHDIQEADVVWLLSCLEGFKLNRPQLEELFPAYTPEQKAWR